MFIRRVFGVLITGFGVATLITASLLAAQQPAKPATGHKMAMDEGMGMKKMTKAEKIANATSAAPPSVSAKAQVLDWPAKEGDAPEVLRAGSNGWTCLPDIPFTKGNDPACMDETWMKWVEAYLAHKAPVITRVGFAYMTGAGGGWGSNSDPYGMKETADNHWAHHNPHVMVLVPDLKSLAGISTDPNNGGPYVMYEGTPYAHIMAPIASGMSMSSMK